MAGHTTNEEMTERIEYVAALLGTGLLKHQIKAAIKKEYGELDARTCERYLSRAKALLIKWSGQPKQEHFVESAAFYKSVIQSNTATTTERIRARERLDALYALEPPKILRVSEMKDEQLNAAIAAGMADLAALREAVIVGESQGGEDADEARNRPGDDLDRIEDNPRSLASEAGQEDDEADPPALFS